MSWSRKRCNPHLIPAGLNWKEEWAKWAITQPNQACQQESNCADAAESIRESGWFTSSGTFSNRGSSCYTKLPPSGQPVLLLSSSTASESTANSGSSTLLRYYNSIEQASIASLPPESLKMLLDMRKWEIEMEVKRKESDREARKWEIEIEAKQKEHLETLRKHCLELPSGW